MGRKKIKPDYTKDMLGINPFVAGNFSIRVTKLKTKRKIADVTDMLEHPDSIIEDISEQTISHIIEYDTYCKVFNQAALRLHIGSLSMKAKALFLWVMYEINPSEDTIFIDYERYTKEFNVVYNTFTASLEELIDSGILSLPKVNKVYWVNPLFIFCGNRIKKYPDKLKFK